MKKALIFIDIQNEYSNQGKLHVANFNEVIDKLNKINTKKYDLVISVRHINNDGLLSSEWATDYPDALQIQFDYEVIKTTADSFQQTNLDLILQEHKVTHLDLTGFMTQNCVTYTALSGLNHSYNVSVIGELCSTIDPIINDIALRSLSTKVTVI